MRSLSKGFGQLEIIGSIIAVTILVAGLWRLYDYAYSEGEKAAKLEVATRDNTALIKARAEVAKLHADVRALEDQHAIEVALIDTNGQEELRRVQAAKDRFTRDVVAGRIRLFDPNARCPDNRGDPASEVARASGMGDGTTSVQLSGEASIFLFGLAGEADQAVVQLTACQKLLHERS